MGSSDFQGKVFYDKSATIAINETDSGEVDIRGTSLVGLAMPDAFTGTGVTFEAGDALNGTFRQLTDADGVAISATVSADKQVALDPSDFAGVQFLKVISNDTEIAERTITLVTRPIG